MLPNSINGLRRRQKLARDLENFSKGARWTKNLKSGQRRQKLATTETEVCERLKKLSPKCEVEQEFEKSTTETEVGDDRDRSLRETQNLPPKCEVEQEFENVGKLIGSASTEAEVGGDGDRS